MLWGSPEPDPMDGSHRFPSRENSPGAFEDSAPLPSSSLPNCSGELPFLGCWVKLNSIPRRLLPQTHTPSLRFSSLLLFFLTHHLFLHGLCLLSRKLSATIPPAALWGQGFLFPLCSLCFFPLPEGFIYISSLTPFQAVLFHYPLLHLSQPLWGKEGRGEGVAQLADVTSSQWHSVQPKWSFCAPPSSSASTPLPPRGLFHAPSPTLHLLRGFFSNMYDALPSSSDGGHLQPPLPAKRC